ncbi:hypothetical protein BDA99DRAFT_576889, partial [Phascolomyces articulosus]
MSYQYDNQYGNYLDNFDESDDFERHINDTEQQQPLTEETGQRVLELVQQLLSKNTTQEANNTTQTANNLCETRCKKPRHRINGQDRIITNISNKHIDTALSTFFQINQDEIPNVRNDLTIHLMRVVRAYIEERLQQRDLPATTPWRKLPRGILYRAIEKYEQKAEQVLQLHVSLYEGSWIAHRCLRTGWNNLISPKRCQEQ